MTRNSLTMRVCARLLLATAALTAVPWAHAFGTVPLARFRTGRLQHGLGQVVRRPVVARVAGARVAGLQAAVRADSILCPASKPIKSGINTFYPSTKRVVALGDVHGDSYALSTVLFNAGLINREGDWVGGEAMLVQVGDVLDRGPDEAFCLSMLLRLQAEARQVGGDVILMLGNHEVMNSDLDYRYVDPLGWFGWDDESDQLLSEQMAQNMQGKKKRAAKKDAEATKSESDWKKLLDRAAQLAENVGRPAVKVLPRFMQGRIKALGGREGALSKMPVVCTVGSTVFCHAGLMPEVVAYGLQRLNDETSAYLSGKTTQKPIFLDGMPQVSPIWHREFGKENLDLDMKALRAADGAMRVLGAKRMVIGHTPQQRGINCVRTPEGREIWRVDTGMSQGIAQGPLETLEIASEGLPEETIQILKGAQAIPAAKRTIYATPAKEMTLEKELMMLRLSNKDSVLLHHPGNDIVSVAAVAAPAAPERVLSLESCSSSTNSSPMTASWRGAMRPRAEV
jgi:hypothetical protein